MSIILPDSDFATQEGSLNLAQYAQGKTLIVYFYPKDSTPGCTVQAVDFTALYPQFASIGVAIVGVSRDSVKSHSNFCTKHAIAFPLISDVDSILCQHFDVIKEKNMYGKMVLGIERSTFVFVNGVLTHSHRKVKAAEHAQKLLTQLTQPL